MNLKIRALRWLAQREHSRAELRRKLLRRLRVEAPEADDALEQVEAVLDWLVAERYLDERRFVESRVHLRAPRFGNRRIETELAAAGVALDADAAARLRASELERACQVRARRFGDPPADAAERARQARFLAGRGFSTDAIRQALRAPG